jgi:hypothetical protein
MLMLPCIVFQRKMSLNVEKRERRLQKKRRKAEAFLAIAELNDLDKATAAKRRKLGRGVKLSTDALSWSRGIFFMSEFFQNIL